MVRNPATGELDVVYNQSTEIETDTSGFNVNLSSADDTVQKALDTIDNLSITGAPASAQYLTATANGSLSAEVDLGSLATGLLKGTVAGGISTISAITDNSTNWDTAYTDRLKWDGGATGLVAATGRTSLGLVIGTDVQAYNANLGSLAGLAYVSASFVKMTGANTFTLDTNTYQTTLTNSAGLAGALSDESGTDKVAFTTSPVFTTPNIGSATGSITGNAGTVTNATLTTALTVNTGTVTLTGNVANTSALTIGAGAVSVSGANTGDNTVATTGDSPTDFFGAGSSAYVTGGTDVAFADGGTGISSWTQYLIPYAATTTSIGQIAIGSATQVLTSNGAGAAPTFQAVSVPARIEINELLSFIKISEHAVAAYHALINGFVDVFSDETGVDTTTSTNESYDSTNDLYSPSTASNTKSNTDNTDIVGIGDSADVEYRKSQAFTLTGTVTIDKVTVVFGANSGTPSGDITMRVETGGASGPSGTLAHASATLAVTPTASATNTWDWTNFSLTAGTYWLVPALAAQATNNAYRIAVDVSPTPDDIGDIWASTDAGATWSEWSTSYNWTATLTYLTPNNMTLVSNAYTANTANPDTALILVQEEDVDTITINTDLTAEFSEDGGTTFTAITLTDYGDVSGKQIWAGSADVSAQAGSSVKWRVKSLNNKNVKVHAVTGTYQ